MHFFAKNNERPKAIFAKGSIIDIWLGLNPLTTNVPHHIETSQLICNANQLTGSYMMGNIGRS